MLCLTGITWSLRMTVLCRYLLLSSAVTAWSSLFQVKRSETVRSGISVVADHRFARLCSKQAEHLPIITSICFSVPGQTIYNSSSLFKFFYYAHMASDSICACGEAGMMIFSPSNTAIYYWQSGSRILQYSEDISSRHPSSIFTVFLSTVSSASFLISTLITLSPLSLTGKLLYTVCSRKSVSSMRLCQTASLTMCLQ